MQHIKKYNANHADGSLPCDYSSFSGEVYILASSKSMAQSHSGKLYKLVDPKRYKKFNKYNSFFFLGGWFVSHFERGFE